MTTRATNMFHPQVSKHFIKMSILKYKGYQCALDLAEHFVWDKSMTFLSLFAQLWLPHVLLEVDNKKFYG